MTPKLFTCPHIPNLRLTPDGCGRTARRMKALSKKIIGNHEREFWNNNQSCLNCKIGVKNMENLKLETKTCPCGKVFERTDGTPQHVWNRQKYCPEHRAMDPYKRSKMFDDLKKEQEDIDKLVDLVNGKPAKETKTCTVCGKEFTRTSEGHGAWAVKKYCSPECSDKASAEMEKKRKKDKRMLAEERRRSAADRAESIAKAEYEKVAPILSAAVNAAQDLDLIKATAMSVGRACFEAALREVA